ncbi:hypothetical protein RSAG8_12978, partial [Rhizoctonia solani AG-8 WAC10335]
MLSDSAACKSTAIKPLSPPRNVGECVTINGPTAHMSFSLPYPYFGFWGSFETNKFHPLMGAAHEVEHSTTHGSTVIEVVSSLKSNMVWTMALSPPQTVIDQ